MNLAGIPFGSSNDVAAAILTAALTRDILTPKKQKG